MTPRHPLAALAAAGALLGAAPAQAMAVFELNWTDVGCGVIGADGTRTPQACDGRSFSAFVQPGQAVYVTATLHYQYRDDGLLLDPGTSWGFVTGASSTHRVTHEAGALYLYSNQCSSPQECLSRPVERVDSFNHTAGPLIVGDNDGADSLGGELVLVATSGQLATWPGGAVRTAYVDAQAFALSGLPPAVPEPASAALMLCGLAVLGAAARRRR